MKPRRHFAIVGPWWAMLAMSMSISVSAAPLQPAQSYEKIEWTWADHPVNPDRRLPDVLLIGDSITRNYYPATEAALAGKANVYLFATSASLIDPRWERQVTEALTMFGRDFAVVHFNNGIHGPAYDDRRYEQRFPAAVAALRRLAPSARLIWASTTPVREGAKDSIDNLRIATRNAVAARYAKSARLLIDDQHALMLGRDDLRSDDVHFGPAGAELEGKQAARTILSMLKP